MCMAISGFHRTGIVLLEADFILAATTDIIFHTAPSEKPTPAQFLNELRYFFFVCLQLKNLRHQVFFVEVPQKSFQLQKLGKTRKE